MKKILLILTIVMFPLVAQASAYNYLEAPNAVNHNFSGLAKQQFEREETLDFINRPEEYKIRREKKDAYLDYKEGKTPMPEFMKPKIYLKNQKPVPQHMEFTNDGGEIRIQEIR